MSYDSENKYIQEKCQLLAEFRQQAGVSQEQAAQFFGVKDYESIAAWEMGKSRPQPKRRERFIIYLLDKLNLRRMPGQFQEVWEEVVVGEWRWKPLNADEQQEYLGRTITSTQNEIVPPILSPSPIQQTEDIFLPPEPQSPPTITSFIGREHELMTYSQVLRSQHTVIIMGMAGVGKTALASVLAQQVSEPETIFWYEFRPNDDMNNLLWKLAGFLYWRGQEDLWQMISGTQLHSRTPPQNVLIDFLIQMISEQDYLFCLDNFHLVEDDPDMQLLIQRFHSVTQDHKPSLIVTARHLPSFVQTIEYQPLNGLSRTDTELLLENHSLEISAPLVEELHGQTEGNAEFLTLAINALNAGQTPQHLIHRLSEVDDIERYLLHQVDRILNDDERAVMEATAILKYSGTRNVIEVTLDSDANLRRILRSLCDRNLLTSSSGDQGHEYAQHAMVQKFYDNMIASKKRRSYHQRAGQYYETAPFGRVRSAYHFQLAGDHIHTARLVTQDVWEAINRREVKLLHAILSGIKNTQFDQTPTEQLLWGNVQIALGQVMTLLGERQSSNEAYQKALALIETLPAADEQIRSRLRVSYIDGCYGLAKLLENDSPLDALTWLQRGLAKVADSTVHTIEKAALYLRMGSVQIALGNLDEAQEALRKGLSLLPDDELHLRVSGFANLGVTYGMKGDIEQSNQYTQQGLEISRQTGNIYQILVLQTNLALGKEYEGEWDSAIHGYQECLMLAEQIGSIPNRAIIEGLLGELYTKRGEMELAEQHLQSALSLARNHQLTEELINIQSAMVVFHLRQPTPDIGLAMSLLDEVQALSAEAEMDYQQPELSYVRALAHFLQEEYEIALRHTLACIQSAEDFEMNNEKGKGLALQGRILSATGQHTEAVESLNQGLLLIEEQYEVACTHVHLGAALLQVGETDLRNQSWQTADEMLTQLGAKRDLFTLHKTKIQNQL